MRSKKNKSPLLKNTQKNYRNKEFIHEDKHPKGWKKKKKPNPSRSGLAPNPTPTICDVLVPLHLLYRIQCTSTLSQNLPGPLFVILKDRHPC
jgi:hypothetical protein